MVTYSEDVGREPNLAEQKLIRAAVEASTVDMAAMNTLLTAQALLISPVASTGLTAIATADAEWTSISLGANTVFADVSLTAGDAYMVCQTAQPGDADTGAIYYAGIVYRIPTRGRTKIWIRRTAAVDVTIHGTDYNTA